MTDSPLEAESAVIGSILIDARCLGDAARLLQPEDFALELNRGLYQAALNLDRENKPIDSVTVRDEARRMGIQVSDQYILQLMDVTPTAANVAEYAQIAREGALRRRLQSILELTGEELAAGIHPPREVLAQMLRSLDTVQQDGVTDDLLSPDEAMLKFYAHRENIDAGKRSGCLRTGYQDMDNLLGGGLLASGMYVLAARPGMGKTTFALNITDRLARSGVPVLFVSLEMDPEQLDAKRISREAGIPASRLLMSALDEGEQARMAEAADRIRAYPVYLNQRSSVTVSQIEVMARRIKGLGMIVIDYIGKIAPDNPRQSRYEYTTEISGSIKTLARRFRVPVLALCQLNRAATARADPSPVLSDLRDTGAVEQDADGVIFLHREDYYNQDGRGIESVALRVIVAKNRHGPVGQCSLLFDMQSSKMTTSRTIPAGSGETQKPRQKPRQENFWDGLSPWENELEES